jgi:hypothetical protein
MVEKADVRDALLSIDWALMSFFLVKLTPFEFFTSDAIKNIGGIALFGFFVIMFEIFGKELVWRIAGKHHRLTEQIVWLVAILGLLAVLFSLVT